MDVEASCIDLNHALKIKNGKLVALKVIDVFTIKFTIILILLPVGSFTKWSDGARASVSKFKALHMYK